MLVNAAPLPQHVAATNLKQGSFDFVKNSSLLIPTDLTGMFLLVDHGSTMPGGVVLHGHAVPLLHMVGHLAVRVKGLTRPALFALIEAPVCPVH